VSDVNPGDGQEMKANWRSRLKEVGKEAFVREEMERLGFWPPAEGATEQAKIAEAELKTLFVELRQAKEELSAIDKELRIAGDIPTLILAIRKRRIERVRAERERKKAARLEGAERRKQDDKTWRETTLPYLGRGVSGGLNYGTGKPETRAALGLPELTGAKDLADALGITTKQLAWLTYHRGASTVDHYTRFAIPKKSGGTRTISSPKQSLRTAQTWILENILVRLEVHDAAMAFREGRSILDNARRHTAKAVVVKADLKDFFPSIRFSRVKTMFRTFGYNEGICTLLALLTTEAPRVAITLDGTRRFVALGGRSLPQGACTSPAITNILCRRLDSRLTGLARVFDFTYTRYADDLVFSHTEGDAPVGVLLGGMRKILHESGFTVNEEKTRVMRPQHRQAVTGVVVNEIPRISRHDLRKFRAFLHQLETQGAEATTERIGKNARWYAAGYLSFVHMVNPAQAAKIQAAHPWLVRFGG